MHRHLQYINLPRAICRSLIGRTHQPHHRMAVGVVIMATGVVIAQGSHLVELFIFRAAFDLVGYGVHGLGAVPFLEWLLEDDDHHGGPPGLVSDDRCNPCGTICHT